MGQLDIFTKRLYNKNNAVQVPNSIFTTLFVQVSMVTSLILKVELLNSAKKRTPMIYWRIDMFSHSDRIHDGTGVYYPHEWLIYIYIYMVKNINIHRSYGKTKTPGEKAFEI